MWCLDGISLSAGGWGVRTLVVTSASLYLGEGRIP
jgi:hypothetical protein